MGVMGETDLTSTVALPTTNPTSPRATAGPPDDGTFEVGWMLYPENSATRIATTTAMTKTARELRRACLLGWGIADCRRGVGCAIGEEGPNWTIFNRARSDNNPYRSVSPCERAAPRPRCRPRPSRLTPVRKKIIPFVSHGRVDVPGEADDTHDPIPTICGRRAQPTPWPRADSARAAEGAGGTDSPGRVSETADPRGGAGLRDLGRPSSRRGRAVPGLREDPRVPGRLRIRPRAPRHVAGRQGPGRQQARSDPPRPDPGSLSSEDDPTHAVRVLAGTSDKPRGPDLGTGLRRAGKGGGPLSPSVPPDESDAHRDDSDRGKGPSVRREAEEGGRFERLVPVADEVRGPDRRRAVVGLGPGIVPRDRSEEGNGE